ncbi:MAG: EH signature domain-containing protein [Methylococcales bacterium]
MNELVLAHIRAATELNDIEFVNQVTPLVQLLDKHSGLITDGLILILKRYVSCKEHNEHHLLRDTLLHEWKSPWLEARKALWYGWVGEEATQMVRLWLTKQHIKDFFELLQAGGQADKQRMEFWLQYADSIDDFWLALGNYSFYNQHADFKRIRLQMEGHCMRLSDSNQNNDNAFLMKIGNFVYIEFGKQNNACHIFSADNLPFKVGQVTVSGTGAGLKDTRHLGWQKKLSHVNGWQREFSWFLKVYSFAVPNQKKELNVIHKKVLDVEPIKVDYSVGRTFSDDEIKHVYTLCRIFNCKVEDGRRNGGAVWVRADLNAPISKQLIDFGLRYKEGKGWWCE